MNFKPNPLLYSADESFYSTFKLSLTMKDTVDHKTLSDAVAKAMKRYPYFKICPVQKGNGIELQYNLNPVPVFEDGHCATLGSEECGGHLLAFGCEGEKIFLNVSHYIADGMGIMPLLMTVLYLYASELYGTDGLKSEKINMPDGDVMDAEYEYPFDNVPLEHNDIFAQKVHENVYVPCTEENDGDMMYAYHLHIPQKEMMTIAQPADGSPVSFLSVMMYRALCSLDEKINETVVAHVQHQYRPVLKAFMSRHSLVSYIPVSFPPKVKAWDVERQNTAVRGQIIIGSEPEADVCAVKRLIDAFPDDENVEISKKQQAMRSYVERSICNKTFGISYVGKNDWCGLDQYVKDIHVYLGEKNTPSMFLMEVMTIGEDFSITFMQRGSTRRFVDAFSRQLESFGIPVNNIGEEMYTVSDTKIF